MTNDKNDKNDNFPGYLLEKTTACFFACFFKRIIWKCFEIFVPLHCQRKKTKFAACLSNKNCLRARHLFPRQSQKRSRFGDK